MLRETTRNRSSRYRRLYREPLEARQLLAADITVDTLVDEADGSIIDGDISLRDALAAAMPGNTINFSVSGTITLTLGELVIDKALTIDGPGAAMLTIDASGNDPTPASVLNDPDTADDGDGSRVFNVDDGSVAALNVQINGLTLTGGDVSGSGGAIYSVENLELSDTVVSGNNALGDNIGGGGVHARRDLTITDSTVIGNTISGTNADGGGVYANTTLSLIGSNISGNATLGNLSGGGGIYAKGTTNITDSAITNNSTVGQNAAGGGIFTFADLTILNSAVSGNRTEGDDSGGGGVYTKSSTSDITLSGSTLSGNSTSGSDSPGGGMYNVLADSLTVFQSTISGNTTSGANSDGGGISGFTDYFDPKTITIEHSTITGNRVFDASSDGGGIREFVASNITITNSIIADNTDASGNHPDLDLATITLNIDFSLVGDNQGTSLMEAQTPDGNGNLIGSATGSGVIAPLLEALADNGGPTLPDGNVLMTHALLPGSPALDAGDPSAMAGLGSVPEFDQRGSGFLRVISSALDMGAFEALIVDTTPPIVTVDVLLTSDNTPQLTGTLDDPTATITVDVGGQIGLAAINNGDGTWTLPDDTLAALADNTYDVVATATDAAMNVGVDETVDELTIDTDDTSLPGDGNLDGEVNGLDYIIWATNFGQDPAPDPPGAPENGDYNDDGAVNGLDYIVWATNFGASATTAQALERAAHDVVFESNDDGDAVLEFSSGGSLTYGGDDTASVTDAVDLVFASIAKKRRSR